MPTFARERLVILGCGYVGQTVAREAMARGLDVTALTRNAQQAAALRDIGVTTVVAELADTSWHNQIAGGAAYVLNCVSAGGAGLDGYRRSYVDGMRSILAWARARGPAGTLVYTSSTSVYPQGGGARIDESAPLGNPGERPALLVEAERLLAENAGACRRWIVLRLAGIYGPGRTHLLEQVRAGEVAGRGDVRLNLAHRDDIGAAIWSAWTAPTGVDSGIFNVADDGAAAKREIVDWLAARVGLPRPRFTGAPAAGRRAVTPDRVIANDRIKAVLGWRPRFPSFREGYENILSLAAK